MRNESKREYLKEIQERYLDVTRPGKADILNLNLALENVIGGEKSEIFLNKHIIRQMINQTNQHDTN